MTSAIELENQLAQLETKSPSTTPEMIVSRLTVLSGKFDETMLNGTLVDKKEFIRAYIHRIELDPGSGNGTVWMRSLPVEEGHNELSFGEGTSWSSNAQKIIPGWWETTIFTWPPPVRKFIAHFSWNPKE